MTLSIRVDGWPYLVDFQGTIEIARLESQDVAVRKVTPDTQVAIHLDEAELEYSREFMAEIRARSENWDWMWRQITQRRA